MTSDLPRRCGLHNAGQVLRAVILRPFTVIVLLSAIPGSLAAAEREIVAVFDIDNQASGLSRKALSVLSRTLQTSLARCSFRVLPQSDIRRRLMAETRASYRECRDQGCQIELGKALSAQKVLTTEISRIGSRCLFNANLFDLKREATDAAAQSECACEEEALLQGIRSIASQICTPEAPTQAPDQGSKRGLARQLAALESARQTGDTARRDWEAVERFVQDQRFGREERAQLLEKYVAAYSAGNVYTEQAQMMLDELQPSTLSVETTPPGVLVLVNGMRVGRSPITARAIRGTYRIRAEAPDCDPVEQEVQIARGEMKSVHLALKPQFGYLRLSSEPPGALISVDMGTPHPSPARLKLAAGEVEVSAELDGYRVKSEKVKVELGVEKEIVLKLQKSPPGFLKVESNPPGAVVTIDGKPRGTTPFSDNFPDGTYEVQIAKEGFLAAGRTVTLGKGDVEIVSERLIREIPMHPLVRWGHISFWSGLGLAALGAIATERMGAAQRDVKHGDFGADGEVKAWAGTMITGFATGGALMVTGAVLWLLGRDQDTPEQGQQGGAGPAALVQPTEGGLVFGLGGSF